MKIIISTCTQEAPAVNSRKRERERERKRERVKNGREEECLC
jgi:hypothetical protein